MYLVAPAALRTMLDSTVLVYVHKVIVLHVLYFADRQLAVLAIHFHTFAVRVDLQLYVFTLPHFSPHLFSPGEVAFTCNRCDWRG